MEWLTQDEIRRRFEFATEFNDIFDAFEQAIEQRFDDLELYKLLFWNKSLSPDEITLFSEQLVKRFPHLGYDIYLWLGEMCALTLASQDNFDHALMYYKKASSVKPEELEPYRKAVDCYDVYIKIPPAQDLIEFLKKGVGIVPAPKSLYESLAFLYEQLGNDEMTQYYNRLAEERPEE